MQAFITQRWQAVNYARNVWRHPLLALHEPTDFIVIDRGGEGCNREEFPMPEPGVVIQCGGSAAGSDCAWRGRRISTSNVTAIVMRKSSSWTTSATRVTSASSTARPAFADGVPAATYRLDELDQAC